MKLVLRRLIIGIPASVFVIGIIIFAFNKEKERRFYADWHEKERIKSLMPACVGRRSSMINVIKEQGYLGKKIFCRLVGTQVFQKSLLLIGPPHRSPVFKILSTSPFIFRYSFERGVPYGGNDIKPLLPLPNMTQSECRESWEDCFANQDQYNATYKNVPILPPLSQVTSSMSANAVASCNSLIFNNNFTTAKPESLVMISNDGNYQSTLAVPVVFGERLEHRGKIEAKVLCKAEIYAAS